MSEWSVSEPGKLSFDEPVRELHVRIVNGTVNVVGTDEGSARLEVSELEGPPLVVRQEAGTLTVAYDDLPWKGFLKWLDRKGWRRSAVVSLAVPAATRVELGVVGAGAVVSGLSGPSSVKGVTGDTTLVGLSGPVRADTVSGNLEAQAVTGDLRFNSVSGDLTVVEGSGSSVKADSVSGSMIVDLDPDGPTDIRLTSVSGEIAIRLPQPADADVEANTASGTISNAFDGLRVHGQWGAHKVTGRLGAGTGKLRATTVSGSIALLHRPAREDEEEAAQDGGLEDPHDVDAHAEHRVERVTEDRAGDHADRRVEHLVVDSEPDAGPDAGTESDGTTDTSDPVDGPRGASGDNSGSGPGDGTDGIDSTDATAPTGPTATNPTAPADGTTDKKVL